jgi:lipoprotein-anchoring transpeptidase ErfK/SrfK
MLKKTLLVLAIVAVSLTSLVQVDALTAKPKTPTSNTSNKPRTKNSQALEQCTNNPTSPILLIKLGTPGLGQFIEGCRITKEFPVITAKPSKSTPTGVFKIDYQNMASQVTINNPKNGTFDLKTPNWMPYIEPTYALHGAPWRSEGEFSGKSSVVRGGSNGCTNLTVEDAKIIFIKMNHYANRGISTTVINY